MTLRSGFEVELVDEYHIYAAHYDLHGDPAGGRRVFLYSLSPKDAETMTPLMSGAP